MVKLHPARVGQQIAAVVAVIYTPKVMASMTFQFFNIQPTLAGWTAVVLAAVLLGNTVAVKRGNDLGSALSTMLIVYSAICGVKAFDLESGSRSLAWGSLAGITAMMLVRLWLRPPVEWGQIIARHEIKRVSTICLLFTWMHVAGGGLMTPLGLVVTALVVSGPWVMSYVLGWEPFPPEWGGKTALGSARWMFAFIAGSSLINWVAGPVEGSWVLLAAVCYAAAYVGERPSDALLTTELCSVAGSGAASALHLMLMNRELMARLAWSNKVGVLLWMMVCLVFIGWTVRGNTLFARRTPPG